MTERAGDGAALRESRLARFGDGATAGIGSLPHADVDAAAAFAIGEFTVATAPTLPNRSFREGMIEQALSADFAVNEAALVFFDLGQRVNLDGSPVKWQFVGPVTLGIELHRCGMSVEDAFAAAADHVRRGTEEFQAAVAAAFPASPQLMLLDEPGLVELMDADFPIAPDTAIDLMSSAMASVGRHAAVGIHCCGPTDLSAVLDAGPDVVSIEVSDHVLDYVGALNRFLDNGGHVAWGAVPTLGPIPPSVERPWRSLSDLWCALVQRGSDAVRLRRQSMVTPACGLAGHSVSVARRIARIAGEVGQRVNEQSTATRFALGA